MNTVVVEVPARVIEYPPYIRIKYAGRMPDQLLSLLVTGIVQNNNAKAIV
ncbi:hypothetical protein RBSWK_04662 [Rhodopirellula baltica SWK14]|uniref:Uncharacterized protein n=1 Tax=Rhodopirellula baltica SWK14 TaxID=993516 RepID=L7CC48_RHOBT|nr:hypothetical protein RBSWK_04662 [Rhodopirellula baltica SWK14]